MQAFKRLATNDRGAGMVEYGMIISIISLLSFSAVQLVGHSTEDRFTEVAQAIDSGSGNNSSSGSVEVPPSGSGGSGGSGATTTTAPPAPSTTSTHATTTTTVPVTTTTVAPTTTTTPSTTSTIDPTTTSTSGGSGGGSEEGGGSGGSGDPSGDPGSVANPSRPEAEFTWWNDTKNGGNGEWKASVTFSNDWVRHQYLKLEVTQIDDKGRRTTHIVEEFYVPGGGTATFDHWGNVLRDQKGKVTGVLQVEVKVLEVKTSDVNWQTVNYPHPDGPVTTVDAPEIP